MSYPIIQRLIPSLPKVPYRNGIGAIEGVVAHATAVWEDSAERQTNYFMKNWKQAFVHFFVDDQCIIQTADTNYRAWGAGESGQCPICPCGALPDAGSGQVPGGIQTLCMAVGENIVRQTAWSEAIRNFLDPSHGDGAFGRNNP